MACPRSPWYSRVIRVISDLVELAEGLGHRQSTASLWSRCCSILPPCYDVLLPDSLLREAAAAGRGAAGGELRDESLERAVCTEVGEAWRRRPCIRGPRQAESICAQIQAISCAALGATILRPQSAYALPPDGGGRSCRWLGRFAHIDIFYHENSEHGESDFHGQLHPGRTERECRSPARPAARRVAERTRPHE